MALAGTAVVIAFAATLLAPVDWIPPLGYGGLAGIPVMLLAALTITPCLLILLGDRFFALGRQPLSDLEADGMLARQLRRLTSISRRFPIPVVVTFLLVTIPFAVVVVSHPMTSDPVALSPDTDARRGYQEIARTWGAGTLQPTVVVGKLAAPTGPAVTPFDYQRLRSLVTAIRSIDGVASTRSLTSPAGQPLGYPDVVGLPADVRQDYLAVDGTFRLVITLAGDPLSDAARNTVAQVAEVVANGPVPGAQVGGATVVDEEYDHALNLSFWRMVSLVSAGVFLLLLFALGSLLIPVRLVATIIMSNIWAIGITFLVFQVWLGEPVINDLPVFLIILMMGLGMDYEIFLITRVRDLVRDGASDRDAVAGAVLDTGRVITAAGVVMAGTLGTMTLSSTVMLREYGVGLSVAVLLDATLIRLLFVPASLLLLGRYNWWLPRLPWPGHRLASHQLSSHTRRGAR
jgi:RND superfamily putative drug exporter